MQKSINRLATNFHDSNLVSFSSDSSSDSSSQGSCTSEDHERVSTNSAEAFSTFLPKAALLMIHVQDRALRSGWLPSVNPQPPFNNNLSVEEASPIVEAFREIRNLLGHTLQDATFPMLHIRIGPIPVESDATGFGLSSRDRVGRSEDSFSKKTGEMRVDDVPWVLGPSESDGRYLSSPGLAEWVEEVVLGTGIDTVVIVGARLTSSVLQCACELADTYNGEETPNSSAVSGKTLPRLHVVLNTALCGDELRFYSPLCNECLREYRTGTLPQCQHNAVGDGFTPVELALEKAERLPGMTVLDLAEPFEWFRIGSFWTDLNEDCEKVLERANSQAVRTSKQVKEDQQNSHILGGPATLARTKYDDLGIVHNILENRNIRHPWISDAHSPEDVRDMIEYEHWKNKFIVAERNQVLEEKAKEEENRRAAELKRARIETWKMKKEDMLSQSLRQRFIEFQVRKQETETISFSQPNSHSMLQRINVSEISRQVMDDIIRRIVAGW